MKLPRLSVRSIMTALVVIALDCLVFRSLASRPDFLTTDLSRLALATLAMANFLTVVIARMVDGRIRARAFWLGFSVGGSIALLATILWWKPTLNWLGEVLAASDFGRWLESSPIRIGVAYYSILLLLPVLFQFLIAVILGAIVAKILGRPHSPANESLPLRKPSLASLIVLLVLASLPALAIEGTLRRQLDPRIARRAEGMQAVVSLADSGVPFLIPKGSVLDRLAGTKVRIELDRNASEPELVARQDGSTQVIERRTVQVTLLDGQQAGQTMGLPYCFLKPLR